MELTKLFKEIISLCENDASFCNDKLSQADSRQYLDQIEQSPEMDEHTFVQLVNEYISTYQLDGHLSFSSKNIKSAGIRLRRSATGIYVVAKHKSIEGVEPGQKVLFFDNLTPESVEKKYPVYFFQEAFERQNGWTRILPRFKTLTLENSDGSQWTYTLKPVGPAVETLFESRFIKDNTFYMRMDVMEDVACHNLIKTLETHIDSIDTLILDLRNNQGGNDSAFYPLLPYCFPKGMPIFEIDDPTQSHGMSIHYTEKNVDLRLSIFNTFLEQELPEETRTFINHEIKNLNKHRGKGFVHFPHSEEATLFPLVGNGLIQRIFVLSDYYCGSSGDQAVHLLNLSPNVIIVGRPTKGITDYSNCTFYTSGPYNFLYPTSRLNDIDYGHGVTGKGEPVDVYIPWSEMFFKEDLDMAYIDSQIGLSATIK